MDYSGNNKYYHISEAVITKIEQRIKEDKDKILAIYKETLAFSEQAIEFDAAIESCQTITKELERAKKDWIEKESLEYWRTFNKTDYLTRDEAELVRAKIAMFTDEQLGALTIEELTSLVRE